MRNHSYDLSIEKELLTDPEAQYLASVLTILQRGSMFPGHFSSKKSGSHSPNQNAPGETGSRRGMGWPWLVRHTPPGPIYTSWSHTHLLVPYIPAGTSWSPSSTLSSAFVSLLPQKSGCYNKIHVNNTFTWITERTANDQSGSEVFGFTKQWSKTVFIFTNLLWQEMERKYELTMVLVLFTSNFNSGKKHFKFNAEASKEVTEKYMDMSFSSQRISLVKISDFIWKRRIFKNFKNTFSLQFRQLLWLD